MGTTANFAIRYPDSTSNVQLWTHIQNTAVDTDTQLAAVRAFLLPVIKRKTVDVAVVNTVTLADDADIVFTNLVAGATYQVDSLLLFEGSTTGDIKFGWSCSGVGAAFNWSPGGQSIAGSGGANYDALTLTDTAGYGALSATSLKQSARPSGILEAGTGAGISFKLRWSQNAIDAVNGTTLFAKSTVILQRLA